jgi:hypothetical protein
LLVLLLLAKVLTLAGRDLQLSLWTPLALFWQDMLFVAVFAVVDRLVNSPKAGWVLYAVAALYIAVNVPIARTLSTPLTWPLLRAARGPLADSIAHHATIVNGLCLTAMISAAAALPFLLRRFPQRRWIVALTVCIVLLPLGPAASARVETRGLDRNVFAALVSSVLPRVSGLDMEADWRASPFGSPESDDLRHFRGLAAGRNVVLIHLESTGARYLRPYGAAEDPMPNLSALCNHGILFENAYTTYPETIKSFFAVHCATFPALDTQSESYRYVRPPSLADGLSASGYRCGLFHSGRFDYLGMKDVIQDRGFDTLEDAGDIGGERESSFGIDEESTVRRMLAWIDACPADQRFFLTYMPIAGHHPYSAPGDGPFPVDREIDRYRNALHYADAALGQLMNGLRKRGLFNDTLFIICGDHGEAFGQHDGNFGHVLFIHEENVRVPYLIAAPGLITEPMRVHRVASLADTAPTVFDLLGLPQPRDRQGGSLLDPHSRVALFCTDYSLAFVGLRDGRWKMIHELDSGRSRLFDLEADPEEADDVGPDHPELVEAYRDHLVRWSAAQKYRIARPRKSR